MGFPLSYAVRLGLGLGLSAGLLTGLGALLASSPPAVFEAPASACAPALPWSLWASGFEPGVRVVESRVLQAELAAARDEGAQARIEFCSPSPWPEPIGVSVPVHVTRSASGIRFAFGPDDFEG